MPKPIVLFRMPRQQEVQIRRVHDNLSEQMTDYYVFVVETEDDEVKIEVFYEKDFTEVQYEELQKIIKDAIK